MDSGSTHSFIDSKFVTLSGVVPIVPVKVTVAGGAVISCQHSIEACSWTSIGVQFQSNFKLLPLNTYDGILGLDWLAQHSPMKIDWVEKWMSFSYEGSVVTLQGINAT